MNLFNKKVIIITASIIVMLTIIVLVSNFITNQANKSGSLAIPADHYYYSAKGTEKYSEIARQAVESFASQDISESATSRHTRLEKYFLSDSPVYAHEQLNIDSSIKKSVAVVTSVTGPDFEGDDPILTVFTQTTMYINDGSSVTVNQTYWVSIKSGDTSQKKAYDIGDQKK